jgi:hypothetical protein
VFCPKAQNQKILPLESQGEIVARIEIECTIVNGNRELIRFALREEKVKNVIEGVWE